MSYEVITRLHHDTGGQFGAGDFTDKPCPAITNGTGGNSQHYQVHYYMTDSPPPRIVNPENKPPYRVPLMSEIAALPWNGFKVASTFSGAGGSCTGYRMAGFRVVWANEFVPAAQASYKANAAADCILDTRDIRTVKPEEILAATGLKAGELDLFDGSPPCQAFSTAGKREKGWGKAKTYEHGAKQCNETLFDEYIRLLRGLQPKVFVAENVSGLVKGTAKGMFLQILAALKGCGYRVTCRVLDAQWLGVPQLRQRTIFVGVRNDLNREPVHPSPLPYRYSVRDALPWITSRVEHHGFAKENEVMDKGQPSPAIMASGAAQQRFEVVEEKRKFTIAELRRICAFPDDFVLCGSYAQQWERLGNSVPPVMMAAIAREIRDKILSHG